MDQTMRFEETLRRLAMIDEGFVDGQAVLGPARGPYPVADGVAADEHHRRLHQQFGVPTSQVPRQMLAEPR